MAKFLDSEGLKYLWSKIDDKFLAKVDVLKNIQGTIDVTSSAAATTLTTNAAKLSNGEYFLYAMSDAKSTVDGTAATLADEVATVISATAKGISTGDYLMQAKSADVVSYRIIYLGNAKATDGDYTGTNGYMSAWDKEQVNKIPKITSTLNEFAPKIRVAGFIPEADATTDANACLNNGYYYGINSNGPDDAMPGYNILLAFDDSAEGDADTMVDGSDLSGHYITQLFFGFNKVTGSLTGSSSKVSTFNFIAVRAATYTTGEDGTKTWVDQKQSDGGADFGAWVVLKDGYTPVEITGDTALDDEGNTFNSLFKALVNSYVPGLID